MLAYQMISKQPCLPPFPIWTANLVSFPCKTDFSFFAKLAFLFSSPSASSSPFRGCISIAAPSWALATNRKNENWICGEFEWWLWLSPHLDHRKHFLIKLWFLSRDKYKWADEFIIILIINEWSFYYSWRKRLKTILTFRSHMQTHVTKYPRRHKTSSPHSDVQSITYHYRL